MLKGLIALVPTCLLMCGSAILFLRQKTVCRFLQLFGAGCLVVVARPTTAVGFEVLPKRWIVERTFAWINRFRRLARDFERYARTVAAFIRLAMIRIMLRRLVANPSS